MTREADTPGTPAHYFSPAAGADLRTRELRVPLAGEERTVLSADGIFSSDGLDKATALLLAQTDQMPPLEPDSTVLDLGCGWGPIALTMALLQPQARVLAVDVNEHARAVCALNTQRLGLTNIEVIAPEEFPEGDRIDAIWSNPPIRIGKQALHELLRLWLDRLTPEGTASMIVGKNLGADSLAAWIGREWPDRRVERLNSSKGFRLLQVSRRG
ncbi:class I SAM-dependent methyltransferase [Helcobacillus massiliensis]|uniref:class I SAM-dependent methyltransferase n=1 Tax=Helcobacillus massiliensis TaxID=521392 RepID=UPI0025576987|nr:methyltransferase [Helcobacillus massiliensis]MDK7742480.1 methyltransferase [Helcobacillus massiliensis]WOO93338.1 methyltransferase [Helcobacillus massiliensis]